MKIPESVRISGVEYRVSHEPNVNDGERICYGTINYDLTEIDISSTTPMSYEMKCITLWHEILHGIIRAYGVDVQNEETVVEMLSRGIYQVLQDNGKRFYDIEEGQTNAR